MVSFMSPIEGYNNSYSYQTFWQFLNVRFIKIKTQHCGPYPVKEGQRYIKAVDTGARKL